MFTKIETCVLIRVQLLVLWRLQEICRHIRPLYQRLLVQVPAAAG